MELSTSAIRIFEHGVDSAYRNAASTAKQTNFLAACRLSFSMPSYESSRSCEHS